MEKEHTFIDVLADYYMIMKKALSMLKCWWKCFLFVDTTLYNKNPSKNLDAEKHLSDTEAVWSQLNGGPIAIK